MDKFFEKLFARIAEFHQKEAEFSQSLEQTILDKSAQGAPESWVYENTTPKQEFYIKEFLKLNKENLPQA